MQKNTARNLRGKLGLELFLGIDIGTTGVRTSVIDREKTELSNARVAMDSPETLDGRPVQDPMVWWNAVEDCLNKQSSSLVELGMNLKMVAAISVDGTSGTLFLGDKLLNPVTPAWMYNSTGFFKEAEVIASIAPTESIACGASSALARLLFAQDHHNGAQACFVFHQADWIAAKLLARGGLSDENNVTKMGYDLQSSAWPEWFNRTSVRNDLLPKVMPVGANLGQIDSSVAQRFGFDESTRIVAGTTDSNASFLASGASAVGEAATALGTTLAIKLISDKPIVSPKHGVYSHKLFGKWLAGGASNTGGGALLVHFTNDQINCLQSELRPKVDTGLSYYPLSSSGERFPIHDPSLQSRTMPRPKSDAEFLQGLLEGVALVEHQAYKVLAELGAPQVQSVKTTGGGAKNDAWLTIRQRILGCPVSAVRADAAYGSALIALSSKLSK